MNRTQKFKYMRNFLRDNKIKDGFMKRGVYAAMFDMPKKLDKAMKMSKNENHKKYMEKMFLKIAKVAKSEKVLEKLK